MPVVRRLLPHLRVARALLDAAAGREARSRKVPQFAATGDLTILSKQRITAGILRSYSFLAETVIPGRNPAGGAKGRLGGYKFGLDQPVERALLDCAGSFSESTSNFSVPGCL